MFAVALAAQALAEDFTVGNLKYEVTDAEKHEVYLVIPSTIENDGVTYTVTSIRDDAFWLCEDLTSLTISNSVVYIGHRAFYSCKSLTSITIPNSVTHIGNEAFRYCDNLNYVSIPESVTSIGENAFGEIQFIYYSGKAFGRPWGAKFINSQADKYWFVYASNDKSTIIGYIGETREITIPETFTNIGDIII